MTEEKQDVWKDLSIGLMAFMLTLTLLRWFAC